MSGHSGSEGSDDSDSDDSPMEVFTLYNMKDKKSLDLVNSVLKTAADEKKWKIRDKDYLNASIPAVKTQTQKNSPGFFSMLLAVLHCFGLANTQASTPSCSSRLQSLYKHVKSHLQRCLCLLVVVPSKGCLDDEVDSIVLDIGQDLFTGGDHQKTLPIVCLVPSWRGMKHIPLQLRNVPTVVVADERTKRKMKDILVKCSKPHQVLDHTNNSQAIPPTSPRRKKQRNSAGSVDFGSL